jgi:SecD/SecF fusion protein
MADRRFKVKKKASPKKPHVTLLIVLAVLLVGSVLMFWPPQERVTQGLDVQGGLSVVLAASKPDGSSVSADEMTTASQIVERRVNLLGASEASVQVQGSNQLLVQMPGVVDQTQALNTIGSTGLLEFVDVSKITNQEAKNAIEYGMAVDRDYLRSFGALIDVNDAPVNAQLFISGTPPEGEEKETMSYPAAMNTNPLTGATLPLAQGMESDWVPLRLESGAYTPIFSGANITNVVVDRESQASP